MAASKTTWTNYRKALGTYLAAPEGCLELPKNIGLIKKPTQGGLVANSL